VSHLRVSGPIGLVDSALSALEIRSIVEEGTTHGRRGQYRDRRDDDPGRNCAGEKTPGAKGEERRCGSNRRQMVGGKGTPEECLEVGRRRGLGRDRREDPAKKAAKGAGKTSAQKQATPVAAPVLDDITDLLQLEDENARLRKTLAEKLRAENADLRKRLGLA